MSLSDQAEPLLQLFKDKAAKTFDGRIESLFKFGSLGDRGDFSLCSDVDVVLMLDKVAEGDAAQVKVLWDEIMNSGLPFADRFSLYWSSYRQEDFSQGKGRFPALDRLDLLLHAVLIEGKDRRAELEAPNHEDLIIESAKFILSFMLAEEKADELTKCPENIMKKGARYFTKFVLFPVRLIFTLDNPNVIGSNKDAVEYFHRSWSKDLPMQVKDLVNAAYVLRNSEPNVPVKLDEDVVSDGLSCLYQYCIMRYSDAVLDLGKIDLVDELHKEINKLFIHSK